MEIISRISKGSRMDQIYIPKNRYGFGIGSFVVVKTLQTPAAAEKPYFYGIETIEPIKMKIIEEIFSIIGKTTEEYDNIIITGSFLDNGFNFNDIDVIIVSSGKIEVSSIKDEVETQIGIKLHLILLDNKTLIKGLSIDPLYIMMLSKCISKKRILYKTEPKIDYKLLDLHLLKSRLLIDNFDVLNGNEKYYLVRNMAAILLFLKSKKVSIEEVNSKIKNLFNLKDINRIKENMLNKAEFLKKYKHIYNETFNIIMNGVKNESA